MGEEQPGAARKSISLGMRRQRSPGERDKQLRPVLRHPFPLALDYGACLCHSPGGGNPRAPSAWRAAPWWGKNCPGTGGGLRRGRGSCCHSWGKADSKQWWAGYNQLDLCFFCSFSRDFAFPVCQLTSLFTAASRGTSCFPQWQTRTSSEGLTLAGVGNSSCSPCSWQGNKQSLQASTLRTDPATPRLTRT